MYKRILFMIFAFLMISSCGGRNAGKVSSDIHSVEYHPFPFVKVPEMYEDEEERISYMALHFWDKFLSPDYKGYCDSLLINGVARTEVEAQFGAFASLLWETSVKNCGDAVSLLFDGAEACEKRDASSNVFETITEFAYKYFYDPNSPVRNEEFYLPYVSRLAKSYMVSADMKPAYEYETSMCALNRVGTKASDISFKDLTGKVYDLYGINADYTLLFFSNPGCRSCKEIIDFLESDPGISGLCSSGRLAVVNIYIDAELDKWKVSVADYPSGWYNGYDYQYFIRSNQTYSVRAIPSLYLLDKDKNVLMKDAPQDKVFKALYSLL